MPRCCCRLRSTRRRRVLPWQAALRLECQPRARPAITMRSVHVVRQQPDAPVTSPPTPPASFSSSTSSSDDTIPPVPAGLPCTLFQINPPHIDPIPPPWRLSGRGGSPIRPSPRQAAIANHRSECRPHASLVLPHASLSLPEQNATTGEAGLARPGPRRVRPCLSSPITAHHHHEQQQHPHRPHTPFCCAGVFIPQFSCSESCVVTAKPPPCADDARRRRRRRDVPHSLPPARAGRRRHPFLAC